ncbi:MAG: gluconate 2-dehydrogenase subunit 3 family protein [Saprospiraceae bacterium]
MSNFEEDCIKKYGRGFQSLDKAQKEQYLIDQDKNAPKFPISMWGINLDPHPQPITFYRRLKSMVLMGYYTSEKISKEVLVYAPVPGDYMGCVPIGARNSYAD